MAVTESQGYEFENIGGTSAGALVAALIAAGYKATQLKELIAELDYSRFKDKDQIDRIPLLGFALSLGFEKGIYEGKFFEDWLRDLLAKAPKKPILTFKDLVMEQYDDPKYHYKLQVVAADITLGKMLVLPRDIKHYGINSDDLDVAFAVRMSMSIPFFYEPVILMNETGQPSYIVDGGILSNYPAWLFDDGTPDPPWPTFGYKLVEPEVGRPREINGPISLFGSLFTTMFTTMMEAHDARYIKDKDFVRTIPIPTLGVQTTQFTLSRERSEALYWSGANAASEFFQRWDFEEYKAKYRSKEPSERRYRV